MTDDTFCVVWATVQMVGFHRWPAAPNDVAHLRARHRHLFHVRVYVETTDPDREVEFHQLQRWLRGTLLDLYGVAETGELDLGERSCEHVARTIMQCRYQGLQLSGCKVSEDGENGAMVTR